MRRRFFKAVVATIVVTTLTLVGCSGSSTDSAPIEVSLDGDFNPLERDQIQDGGELRLNLDEVPEQQNAMHANFTGDTAILWTWYNPVLWLSEKDGTPIPNPAYLTNVKDEMVGENLVVTYDVHPDAVFNDGTPIDYRAFENTWKINNGTDPDYEVASTDGYSLITKVEKGSSDKQVKVTFDGSYPWWQNIFSYLMHPEIKDAETFNTAYLKAFQNDWGAGPFRLERSNFNDGTVSFVRNENWWGDTAKLEKVTFRAMESGAAVNAFQAGEIDAVSARSKDYLAKVRAMGDGIEIRTAMYPMSYIYTFNSKSPVLAEKEVRQALMTALDRQQMATILFNGLDYTEPLPGSLLMFNMVEGYEDNFGSVVSYSADEARKLLDDAGWVAGSDGVRVKDDQRMTLNIVLTGDDAANKAVALATQKMLKDVGVDAQIKERPISDYSKILKEREYDIFPMSFGPSSAYNVAYFGYFYATDSALNTSGTGTKEMDAKIDDLEKVATKEEQIKQANALEREAFATYGVMPYANGPDIVAVKQGLANYGAFTFAILPYENIGWAK